MSCQFVVFKLNHIIILILIESLRLELLNIIPVKNTYAKRLLKVMGEPDFLDNDHQ
jgi:hypothetical protein